MFERFTDRARRVVVLAQEEARLLNHDHIGTEHLLLGVLHEHDGVGARTLRALGISLPALRAEVREVIGTGAEPAPNSIPFTPSAKKVLELSLREAVQLGHRAIGTEHILLGLVREGDGVAAQVLARFGAALTQVRDLTVAILSDTPPARAAPSVPPLAPARCASCGLASPTCGTLFTRATGVLVCERCATAQAGDAA